MDDTSTFTLRAAPGLKVSMFGVGLRALLLDLESHLGRRVLYTDLAQGSDINVETWRRLLYGTGPFRGKTLRLATRYFGVDSWESVVALGIRTVALPMPAEIEERRRREAEGAAELIDERF